MPSSSPVGEYAPVRESTMDPGVSAIVLTFNEERHIRDCLESVGWCDEIWIVDSGSQDRTLAICREYTEKIATHALEDFTAQRNWALDHLPLANEWVLFVDADHRVPPALRDEILTRLQTDGEQVAGYYIPRRQYFWGKPLRFGGTIGYDIWLFRRTAGRFQEGRIVHECVVLDGKAGFLRQPIVGIAKESLFEYIDRINWYSSLEALRMLRTGQELYTPASVSYSRTNQILKAAFKYLPFKPLVNFLFLFVIQQGFRDGYRGFLVAAMQSFYVFAAYAKCWELRMGLVKPEEMMRPR